VQDSLQPACCFLIPYLIRNASLIANPERKEEHQSWAGVSNRNRDHPSSGIFPLAQDRHFLQTPLFLRSRTSVLSLPIPLRHRFFSVSTAQSTHDRALPYASPPSSRALMVRVLRRPSSCFSSHPSRGHTKHDPLRSRRHLLLQLLAFQNKTRVRKNVRTAAVCFPLVGHNVRKASRLFSKR